MRYSFIKTYLPHLLFFLFSVLILWNMLLPGYVLTLDMAWTPEITATWNNDGFNNTYPLKLFLHQISEIAPSWVIQKVLLFVIFFLLFYIPWKFLPYIESQSSRIFAAGVFALNPFVYARMLSGQWMHLFAYALLPLLLYALMKIRCEPGRKSATIFTGTLLALGLLSIHFLYLSILFSLAWLGAHMFWDIYHNEPKRVLLCVQWISIAFATFFLVSSYWIIPALSRDTPLESRFDASHFEVFSAASNGSLSPILNTLLLGGFWGEETVWKLYFLWPQENVFFLVAWVLLFALILSGIWRSIQRSRTRFFTLLTLFFGAVLFIVALGAADTAFQNFNIFLYEHFPFWNGLRDSNKIVGLLALLYAIFAGLGSEYLLDRVRHSSQLHAFLPVVIFLLPATLGIYMWGGFQGQLDPVDYPQDWFEARTYVKNTPPDTKILVLPWHGYLSLDFAGGKIVSNPVPSFFAHDERIVTSKNVDLGAVHHQEVDPAYLHINDIVNNDAGRSADTVIEELKKLGFTHIMILTNTDEPHSDQKVFWTYETDDTKREHKNWLKDVRAEKVLDGRIVILEI